jgi:hypothetical protein|tara:strand:+ start:3320 stop:3634 length:315 start_codon:yes stop_codon:yes gene_type:complete
MSRYTNTIIKNDKETGKRVYGLTLYPPIPIQDGDQFIYPIDGDRFENVAFRYYGDSTLWWIIAEANKLRDGGFALDPSVEIRVPGNIQPILQEFRRINEEFLDR